MVGLRTYQHPCTISYISTTSRRELSSSFFSCKARRRRKFTPFWQKHLLVSFLVGVRTYHHPCTITYYSSVNCFIVFRFFRLRFWKQCSSSQPPSHLPIKGLRFLVESLTAKEICRYCFKIGHIHTFRSTTTQYRGVVKSLALSGKKQARKLVRDAREQHRDASCVQVFFVSARQGAEGNSRHSDRNISLFPSWSG